jgi:hypothetical protein
MTMFFALVLIAGADLAINFKSDLRACGVDETRAIVEHDEDTDDRETGISGSAPVPDDQMRCIAAAAARRGYFVEFADPALNARFAALAAPQMRDARRKFARDWLAEHNLLDKLPVYEGNEGLDGFAVRVEHLCGFAPHKALQSSGPKTLSIAPSALQPAPSAGAKAECLLMALGASDLDSAGVSYGFIGNETYDPPAP